MNEEMRELIVDFACEMHLNCDNCAYFGSVTQSPDATSLVCPDLQVIV